MTGGHSKFHLYVCQNGEPMTEPHYFETMKVDRGINHPGRVRARFAKRQLQHEIRKQKEIETDRRAAMQLRAMIAAFERALSSLDDSINADLERARIRDPSHFAYPISVRTMTTRRNNLKATIAALSDRLAITDDGFNQSVAAKTKPERQLHAIGTPSGLSLKALLR
jgi:hypothetical protein